MSTTPKHLSRFARIDQEMRAIDLGALTQTPASDVAAAVERLVTLYRAVRPILAAVIGFPILRPAWRKVLDVFVSTLDAIAVTTDPTFKAAKDV